MVLFTGVVRNLDHGRVVTGLEYQFHPDAARFLRSCCEEVAGQFGLAIAAVHRVGHLQVGDLALVTAVSSPHREDAFTVSKLLVDRIKTGVPIWKHQTFLAGDGEWVGIPQPRPEATPK
jgi:molybdopterin synthase catalytic subunit